jgi:hypothetical protein
MASLGNGTMGKNLGYIHVRLRTQAITSHTSTRLDFEKHAALLAHRRIK